MDRTHVAIALVVLAGAISAGTGAWMLAVGHPFDGPDGYSDEVDGTYAQIAAMNPATADWLVHVGKQVAVMSVGWGLFVAILGATTLRSGVPGARLALWVAGIPIVLYAGLNEFLDRGTFDTGSVISLIVAALFATGLFLAPAAKMTRLRLQVFEEPPKRPA